jgi:hypothetical protein
VLSGGLITSIDIGTDSSGFPSSASLPMGTITVTAGAGPTAGGGDTVSVPDTLSFYMDKGLGINGFWIVDPASGLMVNLASAEHGGRIVDFGNQWRIDIHVEDGSRFDNTGAFDGVVQVDGALANLDQSLAGFTSPPSQDPQAPVVFWF